MTIKTLLPILDWLPNYKIAYLKGDVFAGLTVGVILIPQGIAYALIAGLPPIYGLYCALLPQLMYVIFGSSRQVAIGPVAMDSLIVATGVSSIAVLGSENYISVAILLAFMVGCLQLLLGVFRLGFLVNFLSKPVITGFTSAVALIIGINQFKNLFGVNFIQSDKIHYLMQDIFLKITTLNIYTTLIGITAIAIISYLRYINKKIPSALIVVLLSTLLVYFFSDTFNSVAIVGAIPSGLPSFALPSLEFALLQQLLPIALTLVMVGYLETISIGKSLELNQNDYRIRPNQELIALGFANIVGSFFKAYPSASSFSRSAINKESGAKTGMAALISVGIVALTLVFFTALFYYLPKTVLAAIIISAVFRLVNYKAALFLFKANKLDFWLLLITFLVTLFFGIEYGISTGAILSLGLLIYRTSTPLATELGKVPNSNFYKNVNRFEDVLVDNTILVFRFDAQLFYANSNYFRNKLEVLITQKGTGLQLIVLDAESINRIDSTGVDMLKECVLYCAHKNIVFYVSGVKGPVRDVLFRSGVLEVLPIHHFFMRIDDAVSYFKTGNTEHQKHYKKYIQQSNN